MNKQIIQNNVVESKSISLSLIYFQNKITNRDMDEEYESMSGLHLMKSIKETGGLIHPVILREDGKEKYELFVGHRRYRAYERLFDSGEIEYQYIPSRIYPQEVSDLDMLLKTFNENSERKNLKKREDIESQISLIPIIIGIKNASAYNNLKMGYIILKKYNSWIRSGQDKKIKYSNELDAMTKIPNTVSKIYEFYTRIGNKHESFMLSARVYFECEKSIIELFRTDKICNRHAVRINKLKSKKDKDLIIKQLQESDEKISYKYLENFIQESNAKLSPIKQKNKLIQGLEHIIIQIKTKNSLMSENENSQIKMYIEKIETLLEKDPV